jgi:hypothetical protein
MGVIMIELGTLVRWRDGTMGIVIEIHKPDGAVSFAYEIKWFNGTSGICSDWQFEVIG